MKKQNLESVTQQLNFDLDQARQELREERMQREEIEKSLFTVEKELNQALGDLEFTQNVIRDRETALDQQSKINRDALSRIATFSAMQTQKIR